MLKQPNKPISSENLPPLYSLVENCWSPVKLGRYRLIQFIYPISPSGLMADLRTPSNQKTYLSVFFGKSEKINQLEVDGEIISYIF